jgi:hypothetical protein
MSIEIHVLFAGKLPSKAELTRAMKELGFPISIAPPAGSLEKQSGYMPMRLKREEAGVEFDVFDGRAAVKDIAGRRKIDPSFDRSANFRWSGDEREMVCGVCAAAALAKLVGGVVVDSETGKLLSIEQAIAMAKQYLATSNIDLRRPGTRPADLKRYLKPLLELRGDLVLMDRFLFVRPVRHLLRGVSFDRTSDKYRFGVTRGVHLLYNAVHGIHSGEEIHWTNFHVWQPHFQPFLMDTLAKDVFDHVGPVTTLEDLIPAERADKKVDGYSLGWLTAILVLSGQRDRAIECIDRVEREDSEGTHRKRISAQRDFVARDIADICREFHAREAAAAKALKLERVWEPSPFPVELPVAERKSRTADPVFATTPWIRDTPDIVQGAPENPGEICFARDASWRNGRPVLVAPIGREEAEERHREVEDYATFARLPDGLLVVLRRLTHWDRNDPERPTYLPGRGPSVSIYVEVYGSTHCAQARVSRRPYHDKDGSIDFFSIDVFRWPNRSNVWLCYLNEDEGERAVYDSRTDKRGRTVAPLTDAERSLLNCPLPGVGEYVEISERLRSLLRLAGYGELT